MVWATDMDGNLLEIANVLCKPKYKSMERPGFGGSKKPGKDKCCLNWCFKVPVSRNIHGQHLYTVNIAAKYTLKEPKLFFFSNCMKLSETLAAM